MTTQKRGSTPRPRLPVGPDPSLSPNPLAQGLSIALFAAAQDSCECRACQVLRKALEEMTNDYLGGGK
jgi:hypothetical protein